MGHNLVRLLYLDETGTTSKAGSLAVAGLMVDGDHEWPLVNERIEQLIQKHIPPEDRLGFVFHATDIFHGAKYFDRRKPEWNSPEKRWHILSDLARIIEDLSLPVVAGLYKKDKFGLGLLAPDEDQPSYKDKLIHNAAALDCLIWADRWLERYAANELAAVVHEDGTPAKPLIKRCVQALRSAEWLDAEGLGQDVRAEFNLPLRRIIDTVHFAEKPDARPLQLADLCAFVIGRTIEGRDVPADVFETIWRHLRWTMPRDQLAQVDALSGHGEASDA